MAAEANIDIRAALEPRRTTWRYWHTIALVLITAASILVAIYRPYGMYQSWLWVMAGLVAFVAIAGHGISGLWRGALVDESNRVSLSRFQMLTWTILTLSAFGVIVIARATSNPVAALDVGIPETLWILMGISTASLLGSPVVKSTKQKDKLDKGRVRRLLERQDVDTTKVKADGQMARYTSPSDSRWSNLFTGEELSNVSYLDLAKIQMFFFTVLVVLTYGIAVSQLLLAQTIPTDLPDVSEGMVALLGISHAGYLSSKAVQRSGNGQAQEES